MKYTIDTFRAMFPDDSACLDYLFKRKYIAHEKCEKCGKDFNYARVRFRRSYQCLACSHQVYPTAGTIFHKSTTPLRSWFTAIFLFTTTRNGVAAKELERVLGVCYTTALRMAHQIKILMADTDNALLKGLVMADETYIHGSTANMHQWKVERLDRKPLVKSRVLAIMEKGGKVKTSVSLVGSEDNRVRKTVKAKVHKRSILVTDGSNFYTNVGKLFVKHIVIDHGNGEYVKNGFTTNNVENYFSTLHRMIKGTHIHVSHKHLPKYVAENTFRYVNRGREDMFEMLLKKSVL